MGRRVARPGPPATPPFDAPLPPRTAAGPNASYALLARLGAHFRRADAAPCERNPANAFDVRCDFSSAACGRADGGALCFL